MAAQLTVERWHIRFMQALECGAGADLLWQIYAPSVPAEGDIVALVRTRMEPDLPGPNTKRSLYYRVTRRVWFIATGHPPDYGYGVDVYVIPEPTAT
jgi:hypothetical protein